MWLACGALMAKNDIFEKTQVQRGAGWDPRFTWNYFKAFSSQFCTLRLSRYNMILNFVLMLVVINPCLIDW